MSLHSYLTRLIWLCVTPLVLLACWLAIDSVRTVQSERDLKAAALAQAVATEIDQALNARIGALNILAHSPLAGDAHARALFYEEARGFHASFDSPVIQGDLDLNMVFNTRVPLGTPLPPLPRPKGHNAAQTAL